MSTETNDSFDKAKATVREQLELRMRNVDNGMEAAHVRGLMAVLTNMTAESMAAAIARPPSGLNPFMLMRRPTPDEIQQMRQDTEREVALDVQRAMGTVGGRRRKGKSRKGRKSSKKTRRH